MEVQVREKCKHCEKGVVQSYSHVIEGAVWSPCRKCDGEGHTVRWVPIDELPLAVEVKRLRLGLSSLDSHLLEMGERS